MAKLKSIVLIVFLELFVCLQFSYSTPIINETDSETFVSINNENNWNRKNEELSDPDPEKIDLNTSEKEMDDEYPDGMPKTDKIEVHEPETVLKESNDVSTFEVVNDNEGDIILVSDDENEFVVPAHITLKMDQDKESSLKENEFYTEGNNKKSISSNEIQNAKINTDLAELMIPIHINILSPNSLINSVNFETDNQNGNTIQPEEAINEKTFGSSDGDNENIFENQTMNSRLNEMMISEDNMEVQNDFIDSLKQVSRRSPPEVISVTITTPQYEPPPNHFIKKPLLHRSQYSNYLSPFIQAQPNTDLYAISSFENDLPLSFAEQSPVYIDPIAQPTYEEYSEKAPPQSNPLTITIDQTGRNDLYIKNLCKRNINDGDSLNHHSYRGLLEVNDMPEFDQLSNDHQYPFYKRSADFTRTSEVKTPCMNPDCTHALPSFTEKYSRQERSLDSAKHIHKRSAPCGCSTCGATTDSRCSPEIIEKPAFVVEEVTETVSKPSFKITEDTETVTKPEFVVKEVTEVVPKPNFIIEEKVENVVKPNFVVEEASQKVKKPTFKVEEQPEVVVKPEFVIEERPEYIEKPEFTVTENVETVFKPKFKIEPQVETVEKPNYFIKETVSHVQKPEYVVTEKVEKIEKPEFLVEEKVEVVKKPKYQIEPEIVPITKPNYIIEETEVLVEKPEFIVTEEVLPVQKPQYVIKENQEVVEKPEFYITEVTETVNKPNYEIEETQQTVTKPSYNVEEEPEQIKKPEFIVQEHPEYVVKPEFIVEETPIPIVKPEYVVEEVIENVPKPCYMVKPVPCFVEKPDYVVHEVVEKVSKPFFKVVEKKETIKKPTFTVENDVQTIIKPCFNVVTCSGPPKRVPPKFSKGSSHASYSSHRSSHYSRRPSWAHSPRRGPSYHKNGHY